MVVTCGSLLLPNDVHKLREMIAIAHNLQLVSLLAVGFLALDVPEER